MIASAAMTLTKNLADVLPIAMVLLNSVAALAGVALLISGLMRFIAHAQYGHQGPQSGIKTPILYIVSALMLWNLSTSATSTLQTLFGESTTTSNLIGYTASSSMTAEGKAMLAAIIGFVRFLGYFFYITGWSRIRWVGQNDSMDRSAFKSSMYRILAGALAINIVQTVNYISEFVGFGKVL
ncbi:hypothetical protein [Stenotrophomonas maltophilia]|uniref:hypothetical protein n=1 Tax=Stenotrophomonas maltophilia TaxID=40324 RepID=UPI000B4DD9A4|nr:hypothetical protein [Stenotrophomonas maltophilia]OWQ61262.1 hypothetical protein CEE58_15645 [Stenotrophomonas maltophilia]RRU72136.1 hypothetical protein EGJ89_10005 [Stenotrophomonas maltophilia]